jgi:hypothetical protein
MGVIEFMLALAQDMLLAAIPAVGFAMVFNVPQRALAWCALLGAIGHGSRMVMMTAGLNIEWATFIASMLVGCIGIQWSRWYLAHPKGTRDGSSGKNRSRKYDTPARDRPPGDGGSPAPALEWSYNGAVTGCRHLCQATAQYQS